MVILAIKTQKIGKGKRNGYGGGIKKGETPEQAMVRELFEESGVVAEINDLSKMAVIYIKNTTEQGKSSTCKLRVYLLYRWQGRPQPRKEMLDPQWFCCDNLPFPNMMLADRFWLPKIFLGKRLIGWVNYGPRQETLLSRVTIKYVTKQGLNSE